MLDDIKIITTADGSNSIGFKNIKEQYHSIHGAYQEALHVFINNGLIPKISETDNLKILEVGFGTGLNAALTFDVIQNQKAQVQYDALEPFPLSLALIEKLNYDKFFVNLSKHTFLEKFHQDNKTQLIHANFTLNVINETIENVVLNNDYYDLLYFDAFGPNTQPELWHTPIFEKLYKCLKPDGYLVTYCAKGEVKRNLKSLGFKVVTLPGHPGKREMTKAIKPI